VSNQEKIHAAFTSVQHALCDLDRVENVATAARVQAVSLMMRLQKVAEELEQLETSVRLDTLHNPDRWKP
jgi:hypothetical protein